MVDKWDGSRWGYGKERGCGGGGGGGEGEKGRGRYVFKLFFLQFFFTIFFNKKPLGGGG